MTTLTIPVAPARPWPSRPAQRTGRQPWLALAAGVAMVAGSLSVGTDVGTSQPSTPAAPATTPAEAKRQLAGLPVRFEANLGQSDGEVQYVARAAGSTLFLTRDEMVFSVVPAHPKGEDPAPVQPSVVRLALVGASPAAIQGASELPGVTNYYLGRDPSAWIRSVPSYGEVRYRELYKGIDLVVHARTGSLEYDYEIAPGTDPSAVAIDVSGARAVSIDGAGDLVLGVDHGEVRQARPVAYQHQNGARVPVDASFVLDGNRVRFQVGGYDPGRPLVIDPTISYSTYLGGAGGDEANDVAVDASGSAYVTGRTRSTDFPTKPAQEPGDERPLAFVTKLTPDGSAVVYSSYFGGSDSAEGTGVALHTGSAYVTGTTSSADFPTTPDAFSQSCGGDGSCSAQDGFLARLASDGTLSYATYLGGRDSDAATDVAVDASGRAYVTGETSSRLFPTTSGSLQPTCGIDGSCAANASFVDGASTAGSATYTSTSAGFTDDDTGKEIYGPGIPPATTIAAVVDGETITLSQPATATATGRNFSIANTTFYDGVATSGSPTYTSSSPHFLPGDVGKPISGELIPGDTTIVAVDSPTMATLSANAEGTGTGLAFTVHRHSFTDGESVIGTPYYTSATAAFEFSDIGRPITGANIPPGTTIETRVNDSTVGLSNPPTASGSGLTFTIDRNTQVRAAVTTPGSVLMRDRTRSMSLADVGRPITGDFIAPGTTVAVYVNSFTINLSQPALPGGTTGSYRIDRDTFSDGVSASGSTAFTAASANFSEGDVGKGIVGTNIPAGTTITAVGSSSSLTLSNPATADGTGLTFTVDRHTWHDGASTTESPPYGSATADFRSSDVGRTIEGDNLAGGTTIASVVDATSVTLSSNATGTGTGLPFVLGRGRPGQSPRRFGFVSVIDPSVSGPAGLAYSTYLGGNGHTSVNGVALNGTEAVVTGSTEASDFPQKGAYQATNPGASSAFVTRISPNGDGPGDLVASTYLGGAGDDSGSSVAIAATGIYVAGSTTSDDFPVMNAVDPTYCSTPCSDSYDAFVTKLSPDGASLGYSTYLGGQYNDVGHDIAVDSGGVATVVGYTNSGNFPTAHPLQYDQGEVDAFATRLDDDGTLVYSTYVGGVSNDEARGVALTGSGEAILVGATFDLFPTTPGSFSPACSNENGCGTDGFVMHLGPGNLPAIASLDRRGGPVTVANEVLINGASFTGTTGVMFGSTPATGFTVLSDSVLKVSSPPNEDSGDVAISVTNASGTSLPTSASTFRFGEGLFSLLPPCLFGGCGDGLALLPNGKVLAVSNGAAELYDPLTNGWAPTGDCHEVPGPEGPASCSMGFRDMNMVVLNGPPASCGSNCGKVLIAGGFGPVFGGPTLKATFLYDPGTGAWRRTGDLNVPRSNQGMTLLPDGTVLAAGGCRITIGGCAVSGGTPEVSAEIYNPATETWTLTTSMNAGRNVFPTVVMDPAVGPCAPLCGQVLAIGGVANGAALDTVEAYDPVAQTWTTQAPLNRTRLSHTAFQMAEGSVGSVVAVGGYRGGESSERLDLTTGEWAYTEPLTMTTGYQNKVVRLANGKLLSSDGPQLYDPTTRTWTNTGPLLHDFWQLQTVKLAGPVSACGTNCGKVLIAGGGFVGGSLQPFVEMYTPRPTVASVDAASGPTAGGITVTITGTGLASVSAVRFGTVNATNLSHDPDDPDSKLTVSAPAHATGQVDVTVVSPGGRSAITPAGGFTYAAQAVSTTTTTTTSAAAAAPVTSPATAPSVTPTADQGYALAAADGGVFNYGSSPFLGALGGIRLAQPVVAMERTPTGKGYWLAAADGGVFAFGDAVFRGSAGGIRLAKPIVGMRATPSGNGYFLVASDGGVFAFGDAVFRGSTGAMRLNAAITGIERSATGNGYWLVGSDGGVFAFGDAVFRGSTGAMRLAQPVVSMARSSGGAGYLLVAADGGVFAFGDAVFRGSTGALRLASPVVGMAPSPGGLGYWLCARDGGVFAFGAAQFLGSAASSKLSQPVVGCR